MGALNDRLIRVQGTLEARWLALHRQGALRQSTLDDLAPQGSRMVVVAPHPDDELLGCGGLLRRAAAERGAAVCILGVTDGSASHPGSRRWPPQRLAKARRRESDRALESLGLNDAVRVRMGLPDGELEHVQDVLASRIRHLLQPSDTVFTTWRHDGHPDHDACGRAVAEACGLVGARLVEVPIWMWHWASPHDPRVPWERLAQLSLPAEVRAAKLTALAEFRTQLEPDDSTGQGPVLTPDMLAHWTRDWEGYFL